jgi:hypothetical protein
MIVEYYKTPRQNTYPIVFFEWLVCNCKKAGLMTAVLNRRLPTMVPAPSNVLVNPWLTQRLAPRVHYMRDEMG